MAQMPLVWKLLESFDSRSCLQHLIAQNKKHRMFVWQSDFCVCACHFIFQPFFKLHWVKLRCSFARVCLDKGGVLQAKPPGVRSSAEGKPETKIIHGYGTKFHPKQYECTNIRKRYEKSDLQVWCSPTVAPSQSTKENMYVQHSLRHPIVPLTDQTLHRLYKRDISICTVNIYKYII